MNIKEALENLLNRFEFLDGECWQPTATIKIEEYEAIAKYIAELENKNKSLDDKVKSLVAMLKPSFPY